VATVKSLLPEPIRVYGVPESLPRTYAVGRAEYREGTAEVQAVLDPGFDPANEVALSGQGPELEPGPFTGASRVVDFRPDRVVLEAELSRPGWVVLVDAFDPGWRALLDGRPAEIRRANGAFRAVLAPGGRHRIEMVYRPDSVRAGLGISAVALAAALALLAYAAGGRWAVPGKAASTS
jgi:uncharacterized membrane protein YfhO